MRAAFTDKGKQRRKYIPGLAHCYLIAKGKIFSWHTEAAGGVSSDENPSNNKCTPLHCTDEQGCIKDNELEDCIYQGGLDLTKDPGNLWLDPVWDCCDVTRTVVRNCKARLKCN